jgi:RNA polymerase sigma factor (sigma-70 family)
MSMKIVPSHSELLERYLASRDQAAFAELAGAHLGLIYSAALRITRSPDLAEEVAQTVLIKLAALHRPLPARVTLEVWLHRVTRSAAIDLVRSEERRRQRESAAAALADDASASARHWEQISPVIDEVIGQLPARDRELILARFFSGSSHGSMARTLGMSEDAVRMRLKRAMEKMRVLLERRGIATSAALLALCLPAHAASPVPSTILTKIPRLALLPHREGWLLCLLRVLSPARLIGTFPATSLAAFTLSAVIAALLLPQDSGSVTKAETPPPAPPLPAEELIDPSQDPGFERETAGRFSIPPWNFPPVPAEDSEMNHPGPQLEVVFKIDSTAPGYYSA